MKRNRYFSPLKTPLFVAREFVHRQPHLLFDWSFSPIREDVDVEKSIAAIRENGLVQFPGYLRRELLIPLREAFDELIGCRNIGDRYGDPDSQSAQDFTDFSFPLLEAALDSTLLQIIAGYYGKPFALGRADAHRILPTRIYRDHSFQWHHDARGKQVKAQILLTDVGADGQRMTYLKGSHRTYYSHWRGKGMGSRFEQDVTKDAKLAAHIVDVVGPAGTITLFDTNGLHSGNRNNSYTRDTLTFYYSTGRNYNPLPYRAEHLAQLPESKRRVLLQNSRHRVVSEPVTQAP